MSLFQRKQKLVDPVDLHGVIHIPIGQATSGNDSTYLTRLDQALVLWGMASAAIFCVAQFYRIDWSIQATLWSVFSGAVTLIAGQLTWFWVSSRNQRWILYHWSLLILIGLGLTDCSIWMGWGSLLAHLCSLWLGISALGYFVTGIGIQAPALLFLGILHSLVIPILAVLPPWQFLLTGVVISGSLFCLAAFQWQHK
ncbi:hypothetical protein IQ260_18365 [Leptolyngbya cf. ectocarpi LEGE 11479]|uniref:DUF2157 domain-containing protein n=1 Tax=Leptolyngbya cf. ectocarpi LEGE 11479 TaxID=1828722 RepID=A0A928ZWB2_LEPEC|nr:hypothetical protein [Leptolyngbya ectocarpi]MBE9068613.1 hypothetical protein [Leptolyngbya cf. ectocarpi LEGE 11479]